MRNESLCDHEFFGLITSTSALNDAESATFFLLLSYVQRYSLWNNEPTLLDLRKSNDVVRPIEESCSMSNCFNFSKCFAQNTLKVLSVIRSSHYYTEDASDACLFVLSVDTIDRDRIRSRISKRTFGMMGEII
uniref:Exostosin GT47 domain-containing protein n=1 Tax=Globodera rostochiensis TaxID=31243 RepID=A0A914GRT3_GLORO